MTHKISPPAYGCSLLMYAVHCELVYKTTKSGLNSGINKNMDSVSIDKRSGRNEGSSHIATLGQLDVQAIEVYKCTTTWDQLQK